MSLLSSPNQILEISLISAQELAPVTKSIRAYAVAWLHPERRLTTRIDEDGDVDPIWNEKFVFRVDDEFLNDKNSALVVEIYASAWLKDVLIGTVGVNMSNLLPPSARSAKRKPKMHHLSLQVRRPSGRPQGILNIGVSLLDSSMRSMPLHSELSASAVGYWDLMSVNKQKNLPTQTKENESELGLETPPNNSKLTTTLQRSQSEKNDSTLDEFCPIKPCAGSMCNGSVLNGASEVRVPQKGIINANGSLCSDVGPSPSVVAAAIAKGIYPVSYPMPPPHAAGGSVIVDGWSEKNGTDGLKTKMDRWRTELPPVYDHLDYKKLKSTPRRVGQTPRRPPRSRSGLFSCFGTAYGCEFTITCGGGNRKKGHNGSGKAHLTASELTYDESSYL
ncbi:hypothetical protein L6164_035185 [Bauhinia variegata]|uniref:Uncharacterized protein n=1 Tax=Bauhinia variegata TaxID=167791 RepID=A0ACB9KXL5_BAUVA|nr:hypothetical protein L6164_035185 [Bauhinia variegata]